MCLSVDRYLAIRHPMTFRAFSTGRYAWKITIVVWLLALLIMIPLLIVNKVSAHVVEKFTISYCMELWNNPNLRLSYDIFLMMVMFVVPGCFVTVSYWRIGCQLWSEGHELYKTDSDIGKIQGEKVMLSRRKVARMLVVLAILFAVCWMPVHLLHIYVDLTLNPIGIKVLPFLILFGHANSALNPILYCFMNKSFRRYLCKMLRCTKKRTLHRQESPVSWQCHNVYVFNWIEKNMCLTSIS